jgi:hypothetical protein
MNAPAPWVFPIRALTTLDCNHCLFPELKDLGSFPHLCRSSSQHSAGQLSLTNTHGMTHEWGMILTFRTLVAHRGDRHIPGNCTAVCQSLRCWMAGYPPPREGWGQPHFNYKAHKWSCFLDNCFCGNCGWILFYSISIKETIIAKAVKSNTV